MEWLRLVHRLRVQNSWLKVLQQEQVVAVQEQPALFLLPTLSATTDSTPRLGVGRNRAVKMP